MIEYFHASKYGNGARVAEEFKRVMTDAGHEVSVSHVDRVKPAALQEASLYVFSSPGRMGRPIGKMRRFLRRIDLPAGSRFALLTTEAAPQPDKRTGELPTEEELAKRQRVRSIMSEILVDKGLVKVAEEKIVVTAMKGPLEEGWEDKVAAFAAGLGVDKETPIS